MRHNTAPPRHSSTTRRTFLRQSLVLASGFSALATASGKAASPPGIKVLDVRVISQQPEFYHGWPTLARRSNGELWLVWSGGREAHVCPFGQVHAMTSLDNGETWTLPRVLLDSPGDDRDAGVLETAKGSLVVTTFTSSAYESVLAQRTKDGKWPAEKLKRWQSVHTRLNSEMRKAELGEWILRSTDGGRTWSTRTPSIVNSPHGPLQLSDGRLLYAGKQLWTKEKRIGVCESLDDGQSWRWLAEIHPRSGDKVPDGYHELHAVEASDGRIIVQIRNHNPANGGETLQSESSDGGKTWSEPRAIGVWGLPSHLLKLRDGRLLMTYGYRRTPFGNQARLSEDNGHTWSAPLTISQDGAGGDLGYPSTAELADGSLITAWYELMPGSTNAVLRQARWQLT